MTYKLHMDGVLTGALNCFCLACHKFLKCQVEATQHIATAGHKASLAAVQYSDKFNNERIRRFKGGYYCEFCNVLLPIASKVNLHISEEAHTQNKGILLLKPMAGAVVAFNDILIDEQSWHGLVDGVCSLCNAEFDDEAEHKADASHCLNLVLKPVQFAAGNAIYRHLDDATVQCLTCNELFAPGKMLQHFDESEHRELYAKCRIETNGVSHVTETKALPTPGNDNEEKESNIKNDSNNNEKLPSKEKPVTLDSNESKKEDSDNGRNKIPSAEEKAKVLESIVKYQSKGINVNLETDTVYCKKCSAVLTFDFMAIEEHIDSHSSAKPDTDLLYPSNLDQTLNRVNINDKTTTPCDDKEDEDEFEVIRVPKLERDESPNVDDFDNDDDSSEASTDTIPPFRASERCNEEEDPSEFAKENQITYNSVNNQSYCRICQVHLPASFKSMKEHVAGANHQKNEAASKRQEKPSKLSKLETRRFIDASYDINGIFYKATIINEKYCIPHDSFYLLTENNSRLRCIVCEVTLPLHADEDDHIMTRQHSMRFGAVPFITSEEDEVIREVRPGLFHCGFCGLVVSGWSDMKQHLKCSDHQDNKRIWEHRLIRHLPGLQRFKLHKRMEAMALMRLFNML
nr:uncharacterized protein LOC110373566 [Helicoverpa armigera]